MELNWADFAVLGIVLLSTLISLIRGFVKEAISLATWVLAIWVSLKYTPFVSSYLVELVDVPSLRLGIAGLILFISVLIVGALVNYIIGQLVDKTGFSGTDRTLGAVFGVLRGVLVVALIVILAGLTPIPQDPWWKQSYLLPKVQEKVVMYKAYLPEEIAENFDFERGADTQPLEPPATSEPQQPSPVVEPGETTFPVTNI
jgi:membrane protein required for colicin V production